MRLQERICFPLLDSFVFKIRRAVAEVDEERVSPRGREGFLKAPPAGKLCSARKLGVRPDPTFPRFPPGASHLGVVLRFLLFEKIE